MGQPSEIDYTEHAEAVERMARELVACPDCTAHRGEFCRNPDGSPCDQHPHRIDAATLCAAELGDFEGPWKVAPAPEAGGDAESA